MLGDSLRRAEAQIFGVPGGFLGGHGDWRPRREASVGGMLRAEAGDGLKLHGVCGGWARRECGAMLGGQGGGEREVREVQGAGLGRGLGAWGAMIAAQQDADVVAVETEVAGPQQGSFRSAQGGEQEDEAGEMARSELHGLRIGETVLGPF